MKLFHSTRIRSMLLGIEPLQPFQEHHTINKYLKQTLASVFFILGTTFSNAFLLFRAKSFEEYTISFFINTTILLSLLNYIIILCTIKKIFKLIDDLEAIIQKRKLNSHKIDII